QDAATEKLPGRKVTLSTPVLVARSKDYLWFPTLFRRPAGDLLAMMTNYPDRHTDPATSRVCWSADGGLTWGEPRDALYADAAVVVPGGDMVLLPYYLRPRKDGLGAPYQRVARGTRELTLVKEGVTVTGWPRPDQPNDAK